MRRLRPDGAQLNYEQYPDRFASRVTVDLFNRFRPTDTVTLTQRAFMEHVVQSGESIRQDIYPTGGELGVDVRPTRVWNYGGNYRFAWYSDDNYLNEFFLYNRYDLTLPPYQLRVVADLDVQTFSEQTVFGTDPFNRVRGTIHPYFAPDRFAVGQFRVEYYHYFSRDYFVHSNQCWFSLQYGIAWDNQLVNYHNPRGVLNLDLKPWLSVGGMAEGSMSEVYRYFQFLAFVRVRFLDCWITHPSWCLPWHS